MIELKDKKVVVIGLARTGYAVAKYCRERGAQVILTEKSDQPAQKRQADELKGLGVELIFGPHKLDILKNADIVVPSPGIAPTAPIIKAALDMGLSVVSEIELAARVTTQPIIGVTGTNGKTTTTALIHAILTAAGKKAQACGNIGRPMIEFVGLDESVLLVVEVSSFQLEFVDQFKPKVGVLLNLSPDHLDWHPDLSSYEAAKMKIFARQEPCDWVIVSEDCQGLVAPARGRKLVFGSAPGVFMKDGWIVHDLNGDLAKIIRASELHLRGAHNLDNAMAATAVALTQGISEDVIGQALAAFKAVEHRLELVLQYNDILFYNDSKATNPTATIRAINSFTEEIILLAGGRNKGNNFDDLAHEAIGHVKTAVFFGESADDMDTSFSMFAVSTKQTDSLEEAVHLAIKSADKGDVVLLSPACASYDMFSDYEERGRCFKAAVLQEVGSLGRA